MRNVFRGVRAGAFPSRPHAVPPAVLLPLALAVGAAVFIAYETSMQAPKAHHENAPAAHRHVQQTANGHSSSGGMHEPSASPIDSGTSSSGAPLPAARMSTQPSAT